MAFNSIQYILFLPFVFLVYYAIPQPRRWALLLCCSYFFYMCWKIDYVVLIIFSTLVDYYVSLRMSQTAVKAARRKYLYLSLTSNLGLLFGFKYLNFFTENLGHIFNWLDLAYIIPHYDILLPVGISFYTFQTLSYTIDVYNEKIKPETHLGFFALYVSFFHQLVAGPIERPNHLLPQLHQNHPFDYTKTVAGLRLILWGLFKKVVIADRMAILVDQVYQNPSTYEGFVIIVATVFFAFQIYCDFSGYSDIAIGSALILGIHLNQNFNSPYFAQSISEFWRRWHISLSTWFRDYVYIPLGGNRVSPWRWHYNLLVTFIVSGIWHGANWTFVVWGAIHGCYMMVENYLNTYSKKTLPKFQFEIPKSIKIIFTFTCVNVAWIFFRSNTIMDAFILLSNMFHLDYSAQLPTIIGILGSLKEFMVCIGLVATLLWVEWVQKHLRRVYTFFYQHTMVRWAIYCTSIWVIIYLGVFEETSFIYFQF